MEVKLLTPPYCIFCKTIEPRLKYFFSKRGISLKVYKVDHDGFAKDVSGSEILDARSIPAYPALIIGKHVVIGTGILKEVKKLLNSEYKNT